MTVGDIRRQVAAYHQVPLADLHHVLDEDTAETVDLFLPSINNAKRFAQQTIDWNYEEFLVRFNDTNWRTAQRNDNGATVSVKQPQTFYIEFDNSGILTPVYHHTKKHGAVKDKEHIRAGESIIGQSRYLSDADPIVTPYHTNYINNYEIFLLGDSFEIRPAVPESSTYQIYCDAYLWQADYTCDDDTDFFTENCPNYLQWYAVVELNNHFQTFIPQQEGNLPPPVKARDEALAAFAEYNNFTIESGRQPK
jgi:hypothetical protein